MLSFEINIFSSTPVQIGVLRTLQDDLLEKFKGKTVHISFIKTMTSREFQVRHLIPDYQLRAYSRVGKHETLCVCVLAFACLLSSIMQFT